MNRRITRPLPALLLLFLLPLAAIAQAPQDYQQARQLFDQHQYAQAAAAFSTVEKVHPGQTDAPLFQARALIQLDRIAEADRALTPFVNSHPKSDDGLSLLAFLRFRENHPRQSLRLFTRAAALKTPISDDFKIVALDYALLQDYDDAAKYLQVALQFEPGNLDARYHLGRVRYLQNRFDDAIAAFQTILKADPRSVRAENNLGLALEGKGLLDQAIATYHHAIALEQPHQPGNEQPYINLGSLLTRLGRTQEARPLLEKAVAVAPNSARAHYELGKACFRLNQLAEAQQQLERAVAAEPADASSHYQLGMLYRKLGKTALEKRELQTAARLRGQK